MSKYVSEVKDFQTLSLNDLYQILFLRTKVFVVEQNCVYQDIDFKDQRASHLLIWDRDILVAYARIFPVGIEYDDAACIGRVIVDERYRGQGLANTLMRQSLEYIRDHFSALAVEISAQEYLIGFYKKHGFVQTSDVFLEDGIPHVQMRKTTP